MSSKITEWKRIDFSKEPLDFSGALRADLENDGNALIALTFHLKNGRTVRLRKSDYTVVVEEPVIPVQTKYIAKSKTGLTLLCDSHEEAEKALSGIEDGEIVQTIVPKQEKETEIPF